MGLYPVRGPHNPVDLVGECEDDHRSGFTPHEGQKEFVVVGTFVVIRERVGFSDADTTSATDLAQEPEPVETVGVLLMEDVDVGPVEVEHGVNHDVHLVAVCRDHTVQVGVLGPVTQGIAGGNL